MRKLFFLSIIFLFILVFISCEGEDFLRNEKLKEDLFENINQIRLIEGSDSLKMDENLNRLAQMLSDNKSQGFLNIKSLKNLLSKMGKNDSLSSKDMSRIDYRVYDFMEEPMYAVLYGREEVFADTIEAVDSTIIIIKSFKIEGIVKCHSFYEKIINPQNKSMGIGVSHNKEECLYYIVQVFLNK